MTLNELLGRITSSEISEQMAYDRLQIRLSEEAEQARALSNTVETGLQSIKREVRR